MKKFFLLIATALLVTINANSQYLVSAEVIATYTAEQLNFIPGLNAEYDVEMYKVVYNTTGANGEDIIASGAFSRPLSDNCSMFPVVIYSHGTTLNKENVPSRINNEAQIINFMGGLGYYALAPDYVGMGDSPGLHPYQHALTAATANVDLIRAMREFLTTINEEDNGEVMITGYSQGGHAAMATHKYIEENNLLSEFNVLASAPLSGAYDMSGSQTATILSGEPYSNPGYIVYVMSSFDLVYGDIYDTYADVLQSPYDTDVVPFFDGNNTTYSMGDLNPLLPQVITDLMTPEAYSAFESDLSHPLRVALADNDVYDWTPERTVRMYYCTQDEQVDFSNSTTALATMEANGASDVSAIELGPLSHGDCTFPALLGAVNYFNSVRTECVISGLDELHKLEFTVYPNPSKDFLAIDGVNQIVDWVIYDASGQIVLAAKERKKMSSNGFDLKVDTRSLSQGVYQIIVTDEDGHQGVESFVK